MWDKFKVQNSGLRSGSFDVTELKTAANVLVHFNAKFGDSSPETYFYRLAGNTGTLPSVFTHCLLECSEPEFSCIIEQDLLV